MQGAERRPARSPAAADVATSSTPAGSTASQAAGSSKATKRDLQHGRYVSPAAPQWHCAIWNTAPNALAHGQRQRHMRRGMQASALSAGLVQVEQGALRRGGGRAGVHPAAHAGDAAGRLRAAACAAGGGAQGHRCEDTHHWCGLRVPSRLLSARLPRSCCADHLIRSRPYEFFHFFRSRST